MVLSLWRVGTRDKNKDRELLYKVIQGTFLGLIRLKCHLRTLLLKGHLCI